MVARQKAPRTRQVDNAPHPRPRSTRIKQQSHFRFEDLPPEIRNTIYSYALLNKPFRWPSLFTVWEEFRNIHLNPSSGFSRTLDVSFERPSLLTKTAKTLSQVSRAIRHESMGIYFAKNFFEFRVSPRKSSVQMVEQLEDWANVWGDVVAPKLRFLKINNVRCYDGTHDRTQVDIDLLNATQPVAISNGWLSILRGKGTGIDEAGLNALVLSILRPKGALELTNERILTLLVALQLLPREFRSIKPDQRAELLTKLATRDGQDLLLRNSK